MSAAGTKHSAFARFQSTVGMILGWSVDVGDRGGSDDLAEIRDLTSALSRRADRSSAVEVYSVMNVDACRGCS